jgi:hypothetical protein
MISKTRKITIEFWREKRFIKVSEEFPRKDLLGHNSAIRMPGEIQDKKSYFDINES